MVTQPGGVGANPADKIASIMARFESLQKSSSATRATYDSDRAKAAARGELGPEWQKVQQRIDLEMTTLEDVFAGRDESPEALALVARSRENLVTMREDLERGSDDDEPATDPMSEIGTLSAGITERLARLRAMTEDFHG